MYLHCILDDGYRRLNVGQKVEYAAVLDEAKNKWKATRVTGPKGAPLATIADPRAKGKGKRMVAVVEEVVDTKELEAKVVTQVEYYLGDKNLKRDQWMRNLIEQSGKGAVKLTDLLKCKKLKVCMRDKYVSVLLQSWICFLFFF